MVLVLVRAPHEEAGQLGDLAAFLLVAVNRDGTDRIAVEFEDEEVFDLGLNLVA